MNWALFQKILIEFPSYFLQVIRLLEQFSVPDLVISLANTALSVADDDDPNIVSHPNQKSIDV